MGVEPQLQLGGVVEELAELIRSDFETDEWRRAMLLAQQRQLEALRTAFAGQDALTAGTFTPVRQALIFDSPVEAAGDDVLDVPLDPEFDNSIFRTTVAEDTGLTFRGVFRGPGGGDPVELDLNQGNALSADAFFTFDIPVHSDISVNYEFSGSTQIQILLVQEIRTAGP